MAGYHYTNQQIPAIKLSLHMDQFKTYTIADIEAERKRVGIKINDLCRAIGIDRQQYHRNRVSGRIWLDRANAMLKFIYAQENAKEKEQEPS